MPISIIVAAAENNVIGKNNQLIWHLSADLQHFKKITMGHTIVMGRKTFESIGKPLPGRVSIIITRNKNYTAEGCIVVNSLEEALQKNTSEKDFFIIGGAEIFNQSMHLAQKIYFTKIFHAFEGDCFFPKIDEKIWELRQEERFEPTEKNNFSYAFCEYEKI
ncbi:MAG: dihydrofolate reductase [Bacteroidia bacterium]